MYIGNQLSTIENHFLSSIGINVKEICNVNIALVSLPASEAG